MKKNDKSLRSFKVLSLCLSYPDPLWIHELPGLMICLQNEGVLPASALAELRAFTTPLQTREIIELQIDYVAFFDQDRRVSLHLFEHVHGESRDRGQAMVDLGTVYQQHGLLIEAKELPDYLPLFLECLSVIAPEEAQSLLQECIHIIQRIAKTLAERGNPYTAVFNAILSLSQQPMIPWVLQAQRQEDPNAAERLDKEWEEEEIKFLSQTCTSNQNVTSTTHPIDISALTKRPPHKETHHE